MLTVCSATSQDTVCTVLSRTTTTHLEEGEAELELQRLERKDGRGEVAASERWQHFLHKLHFFLPPAFVSK